MQKIMAVINRKGGVGKTTTSVNLATELSHAGNKVLFIDIDPQANGTKVISGGAANHDVSIASLLENPKTPLATAIYQSPHGPDYIPSSATLSRIQESIAGRYQRENILRKLLPQAASYDYIVIDCPPDSGIGTLNAVVAADNYLIPIDGGVFALDGLADLLSLLAEVNENEGRAYHYMIMRNEFKPSTSIMNGFLASQLETQANHLLTTRIKYTEIIQQAAAMCMPIRKYKPGSVATQEIKDLTKEIIGRLHNGEI